MVGIILGAAAGTIAESMADARKYLEEKKAGLENLYITSGFDSRDSQRYFRGYLCFKKRNEYG
jgi:hypothetical protein